MTFFFTLFIYFWLDPFDNNTIIVLMGYPVKIFVYYYYYYVGGVEILSNNTLLLIATLDQGV